MRSSYYELISLHFSYPLYVALSERVSVEELYNRDHLWQLVRVLTELGRDKFEIFQCSRNTYRKGVIKIDLTVK